MKRVSGPLLSCAALWLLSMTAFHARADLIHLKNGGQVRGKIERKLGSTTGETIRIETLTGGVVEVARPEVEFISWRSFEQEEFETLSKSTPQTPDELWKLAEWCRLHHLSRERRKTLQRIVTLDAENERAHRALGNSLHEGEWVTRDELMESQGYVKHKGRYITPQELELLVTTEAEREADRHWHVQVRLWHGWFTGSDPKRRAQGYRELSEIRDPQAVPALGRFLGSANMTPLRLLYVQILSRIPGQRPIVPLATLSLTDPKQSVRTAALGAIPADQHAPAREFYAGELRNGLNVIVRRAAEALETIGNEDVVPNLIDALVTTHRYKVRLRGSTSPTYSFGTDGSFGMGTAQSVLPPEIEMQLRTGQLPNGVIINDPLGASQDTRTTVVTVYREHRNAEVLATLEKLTGKNWGYSQRTWHAWWAASKDGTLPPVALQ